VKWLRWVVREVVAFGGGRGRQRVLQRFDRGKLFFDLLVGCSFGFSLSLGFVVDEKICLAMVAAMMVNPYE